MSPKPLSLTSIICKLFCHQCSLFPTVMTFLNKTSGCFIRRDVYAFLTPNLAQCGGAYTLKEGKGKNQSTVLLRQRLKGALLSPFPKLDPPLWRPGAAHAPPLKGGALFTAQARRKSSARRVRGRSGVVLRQC